MQKEAGEEIVRVRMPRGKEVIGTVTEILGASRFRVECKDGKERICRIPGRLKRRVYIKIGYVVLVEPWDVQSEERGDIIWSYKPAQVKWLMKKGMLDES